MNLINTVKMTLLTGFAAAALMTQSIPAYADDVIVDGKIITAENYDAGSDPEWKYVPVRRTADAAADNDDNLTVERVVQEAETRPTDAFFVRNDDSTVSQ